MDPLKPLTKSSSAQVDPVQKDQHRLAILEQAAQNPAYSQQKRSALATLARAQRTVLRLRQHELKAN